MVIVIVLTGSGARTPKPGRVAVERGGAVRAKSFEPGGVIIADTFECGRGPPDDPLTRGADG